MEQIKQFFSDLKALIDGTLFIYADPHEDFVWRKVYYSYHEEWDLHKFSCPSLDYSTTVTDDYSVEVAWEIVKNRMDRGLQ